MTIWTKNKLPTTTAIFATALAIVEGLAPGRLALIWMVFLGIAAAFRQGAMVNVDVLYRWSTPRVRRVLDWVVCFAALLLIAIIVWWGWDYAVRGKVQSMAGLESISMFWAYLALPVGGLFAAMGIIGNLVDPKHTELENAQ